MESNKFDVVIKSHQKDYCKLRININSFRYLNPQPSNIYIVSKDGYVPSGTDYDHIIKAIKDEDVTPFIDRDRISYRKNWTWCNLVSLFQNFTENDYYLDVQADNFFLKEVKLFNGSIPIIYNTKNNPANNNVWNPYFNFSRKIFGIDKISLGNSYITEFILYRKNYTKLLIHKYGTFDLMMEKIYESINSNSYPADQEIYGNYVESSLPKEYEIIFDTKLDLMGIETDSDISEKELLYSIEVTKIKKPEALALSYHSWWDDQL